VSRACKKARFFFLHPDVNPGKVKRFEALFKEYILYTRICLDHMLSSHRFKIHRTEKQGFFPSALVVTSQIEKNAREHASNVIESWAKVVYPRKMKGIITELYQDGLISEAQAKILYTVGKHQVSVPNKKITQEGIDSYWKLLDEHGGEKPVIRDNTYMRMSVDTAPFEDAKGKKRTKYPARVKRVKKLKARKTTFKRAKKPIEVVALSKTKRTKWLVKKSKRLHGFKLGAKAKLAPYWMKVSSLTPYKRISLPFMKNPYVDSTKSLQKTINARKKRGLWRFEIVETKEPQVLEVQDLPEDAPRLGIDVGLNVLAAVSNGDLYGVRFKPKFDKLHKKVNAVRANRQRQGLKENSLRLAQLESNLSGAIKSEVGKITNRLVKKHSSTIFVLEDLNLSGSRGQKRFAYRAIHKSLESKAPTISVNPAYTSQECPSCHFVSRSNRSGTKFHCRSCGLRAHADWVGSSNVVGRSWEPDITCETTQEDVKATLKKRFIENRFKGSLSKTEPKLKGPNLTTRGSPGGSGTDSKM
jgi:transposase